jgi:hypothetical protein
MSGILMMVGMNVGEERHHLLPCHSRLVPRGLWRPPPCIVGFDISYMWLIYDIFFNLAFCRGLNEGSSPLESILCGQICWASLI